MRHFDNADDALQKILESIKKHLTEKEFEDFVQTAKVHLNNAISKEN